MTKRTGGEAIVDGLLAHGVDTVFGIPGAQIYGLFDAMQREAGHLRVIGARHEQACGYMAFGYARASGRPGVFSVVPGPGVLNAGAALLTAFGCNEPVLCLTGEVPTAFLGLGKGHLHEMPNQRATLASFLKSAARAENAGDAGLAVARAFQEMLSGRRGPASVEMPWDVFTQAGETALVAPLPLLPSAPVDSERVADAAKLIKAATAPMIFVGSGAIDAGAEILELAELLGAPVVGFRSGRGIVSEAHELGVSLPAAYDLWHETDLMIGIGTRLELPLWRWPYRPAGQKAIRIDIDAAEMRRFRAEVGIVADARPAVRALADAVSSAGAGARGRRSAIAAAKEKAVAAVRSLQPQMGYIDIVRGTLPVDGVVTEELCQTGFSMWVGYPVYRPRTFITSGYQGTLGAGFPTALGAKVACPDRPVVCMIGDGGFMFAVQELATAVQYGINVVTVVFNNEAYGNVLRDQMQMFNGRVIASELVNPDFMKLADSFGVGGARVRTPAEFGPALEKALAANAPSLIEVMVPRGSEVTPWTFIHPAKPTTV
jgi:acetolactate synthase-1/2/3 large subunit